MPRSRAAKGDVDVIAVSIARYASIAGDWLLLPHGASIGRGYGPVVVASNECTLHALTGKRIGVPGLRTTAYATLRLLLPEFEAKTRELYDVTPDGEFIMVEAGESEAPPSQINVVLNWVEELKLRIESGK